METGRDERKEGRNKKWREEGRVGEREGGKEREEGKQKRNTE